MTKKERALINAALRWLAADRTETVGNEDNFAECGPFDDLIGAIEAVSIEYNLNLQDCYDPEPLRRERIELRKKREKEMKRRT